MLHLRRRTEQPPPEPRREAEAHVLLLDGVATLAAAVELVARNRFACNDHATPDVVVVEPMARDELMAFRDRYPGAGLIVVDRREASSPEAISRALAAGVDAYVMSASVRVLVAHVDALLRWRGGPETPTAIGALAPRS